MSMIIREATEDDLPGMVEIYNEVILNTTAVYSEEPQTLAARLDWYAERHAQGYPVFVAVGESGVLGFSSHGAFRAWPAYRHTVEGSVYVRSDLRGRGIGARLIPPLLTHARAAGKHAFIAGVDASNASSLRLHERFGFRQVAHFREVGWKFGRWLDLLFLELILDETSGD